MNDLQQQSRDFAVARHAAEARAAQTVALQLCCGMDLSVVMKADGATRRATLFRLDRLLERERLKGLARHLSYDLNRHIALKQAIDLLHGSICQHELSGRKPCHDGSETHKKNGAARRRRKQQQVSS